jgi:hypothetical protein
MAAHSRAGEPIDTATHRSPASTCAVVEAQELNVTSCEVPLTTRNMSVSEAPADEL